MRSGRILLSAVVLMFAVAQASADSLLLVPVLYTDGKTGFQRAIKVDPQVYMERGLYCALSDAGVDDDDDGSSGASLFNEGEDPLYDEALEIVLQAGKASASYIQRRLKIGYNRAARLVEEMEERGIVGPANGSKPREVIHVPS